jgi:aspartyl-tRNA(Asn)/glutamyl-tRNA(Gln) amidotransferase subunit C
MRLTREEVDHIALLARLGLNEQDRERLAEQLSNILENMEALKEVATSGIPPTTQSVATYNVFREDVICLSLPQDQVLTNAPERENRSFKVRPILE